MAVAFANIFMSKVESEILNQSVLKPLVWKRYIGDIFSLWTINREGIMPFIEQANNHHLRSNLWLKFSETKTFLDTSIYKGERLKNNSVLDLRTHVSIYSLCLLPPAGS